MKYNGNNGYNGKVFVKGTPSIPHIKMPSPWLVMKSVLYLKTAEVKLRGQRDRTLFHILHISCQYVE